MLLDFWDDRPDALRVVTPISRREGFLVSIIGELLVVIVLILAPRLGWFNLSAAPMPVAPPQDSVNFVTMEAPKDVSAPPKKRAEASDKDRRATAPQPAPKPADEQPASRGNTPEKVIAAPVEKPAGPENQPPSPPAPPETAPPIASNIPAKAANDAAAQSRPGGGSLGDSLRNLDRYLRNETFSNPKGGGLQDPDFQFDSKGVDFGPWIRRFISQVRSNWNTPESVALMSGHVVIQFYVLRNGTIIDVKVLSPAGVPLFNSSALNALKMSNPTYVLPEDYPSDRVLFTVTFHYNEGDRER